MMYFIPEFDDTDGYYQAASSVGILSYPWFTQKILNTAFQWWSYWGDVVDGLFSWDAAWPPSSSLSGTYPGDVSPDLPVIKGAVAHDKGYMIGLCHVRFIHTKL